MAKNTGYLDAGTDNPALARVDMREMFQDLGYADSGDVSKVTTTGEASKLMKWGTTAKTIEHEIAIKKTDDAALDVQNDAGTSAFKVDTSNLRTNFNNGYMRAYDSPIGASSTVTVTVTATGTVNTFNINLSTYTSAGTGAGHLNISVGGYIPSASLYNVTEISRWVTGGITISAITKNAGSIVFTITNASGVQSGTIEATLVGATNVGSVGASIAFS